MNTVIIHPNDPSTDFLKPIYRNVTEYELVSYDYSKAEVLGLIEGSDRAILMGHGSPSGLFSVGMFAGTYIIDSGCVEVLSTGMEHIYIWCNADRFVDRYNLSGFYSGMFISEVSEANFCGLVGTTQEMVNESNDAFARIVGECINESVQSIYKYTTHKYSKVASTNPVARYNLKRLFIS